MSELRQLTSARGIAAWFVVLYHIRQSIPGLPDSARAILGKGYLAVDFFFLLSGFVIWLTWHDRLRQGDRATIGWFLHKRIARIWPLHLAMLAVAVALAATLALTGRPDPAYPFAQLPLHLLLIQNWGFTDHLAWNDPAWSISCEFAAYLAFPLLVMVVDWRALRTRTLVLAAAAVLATLYALMAGEPSLGADIPRFGLVRCLAEFTTGTIVAALYQRQSGRIALPLAILLSAAWALGAPEILVVPAALAATLLALARAPRILQGRVIHWLGDISYATYLSHFLLWKIVKLAVVTDATHVDATTIVAYLAIVVMASAILYHGFERPAQRIVNGVRRARPPLPSSAP